jgi:O-antigen ligase
MTQVTSMDGTMECADTGGRAVRAAYYAFMMWIPVETILVLKTAADGDGGGVTVSRLLGFLLFGLALIEWRRCFRIIPIAFWLIAWYLAVYALSQLRIPSSLDAMFRANQLTLIQMAALFLISANLFADARFRGTVLRMYGWWVSLVAIGMILGVFGGEFGEGRDSILGQDPNVAAAFFALGAVCIAGDSWIFSSKRWMPRLVMSLLAIAAILAAILETGSRGGLLVFSAGIVGLAICGGKATRKRRALIAGAVIGMLGLLILREFRNGTNTASRLAATWSQGDTAGRTAIYDEAWSMFLRKPLLGYGGENNFSTLGIRLREADGGYYFRDTHNLLLAVLTEVGVVGAAPFVVAILYALWISWRHGRRTDDSLPFALMCAQILTNTSLTGYHQKLFWIVLAAAVACGMEESAA